MNKLWTPREDQLLSEGRTAGYSFAQIADIVKRPRNACIGRARRLGLESLKAPPRPKTTRLPWAKPGTTSNTTTKKEEKLKKLPKPDFNPILDKIIQTISTEKGWPKPMTETAVLIFKLTDKTCRMPLWFEGPLSEQFYCGAIVAPNSSWCPSCRKLVTISHEKKKQVDKSPSP